MIITGATFHTSTNTVIEEQTLLDFSHIVDDFNLADAIVFSTYQFKTSEEIYNTVKLFERCGDKRIIIDFSREMFSKELFDHLSKQKSLANIEIYTNGFPPDIASIDPLIKKGVTFINLPFFLKYYEYYKPERSNKILNHRNFLLLTGKMKIERVALVGLLSYYNLLKYGHVSYIRGWKNFGPEKESDYFNSDSPISQKEKVTKGLKKIKSDLNLDTEILSYNISHGRRYNEDYYKFVDFVIVCESDANRDAKFITEKTAKCIQQNKKFILLGSHGLLSYIRQEAKTHLNKDISPLVDWCDTSYDNIHNVWDRVDKIVEIIQNEIDIRKTK